jgi:hypothetical protein
MRLEGGTIFSDSCVANQAFQLPLLVAAHDGYKAAFRVPDPIYEFVLEKSVPGLWNSSELSSRSVDVHDGEQSIVGDN